MKINGKFAALAGAALLMGSAAFAQATDDYNLPQGFTFYNEISSDLVEAKGSNYNHESENKNYQVEFAGIIEKVGIGYNSEKFEFELAPKMAIKDAGQHWKSEVGAGSTAAPKGAATWQSSWQSLNNDDLAFLWDGLDWGVRFTPFEIVDLMLHKGLNTPGANLPVAGENVGGNLAGDGFGVVIKPIDGLRIGLEIPFTIDYASEGNYMDAEYEDKENGNLTTGEQVKDAPYKFRFNAGVDYKLLDMVTVGLFTEDVINRQSRSYGMYADANVGFINFKLGYTYNGGDTKVSFYDWANTKVAIGGHHKANLAVGAAFGDLSVKMDALFNFFKNQSIYDLYAGLAIGYDVVPGKFNVGLQGRVAYDMGNYKNSAGVYHTQYREKKADIQYVGAFPTKKGTGTKAPTAAAPMVGIKPSMTYTTGKNTFNVAANLQYWLDGEGTYAASVPVSWKYTF